MCKFTVVVFIILACASYVNAQNDSGFVTRPSQKVYAARFMYGSIFAHSIYIQNTAGAHPRGAEVEVSKQLTDEKTWAKYNCYPRMGWTFSYFNFNTPILGESFSASYFVAPNFRLTNRGAFFINAGGGLSFLTKPFDSLKNPENQTYSLPVNFFLHLGVGVNYRISNKVSVDLTAAFEHNSNGDFEQPNRGINWPAATFTMHYNTGSNVLPKYQKQTDRSWRNEKRVLIDAGIFYSPKAGYNLDSTIKRKLLIGSNIQVSKRVSALSAVTASAEIYYDGAFKSMKALIPDNSSPVLAGIAVGHEFLFRKFIFSQQLGLYVHKNSETFTNSYRRITNLYHRWGLRYKVTRHWYAGINLMAREDIADFIDVRVMYRF